MFVEPVHGHHINPYDLAVDPYARMVYWTDTVRRVIAVTRVNGENVGSVVDDVDARSIALAPEEGCVHFCVSCNDCKSSLTWKLYVVGLSFDC